MSVKPTSWGAGRCGGAARGRQLEGTRRRRGGAARGARVWRRRRRRGARPAACGPRTRWLLNTRCTSRGAAAAAAPAARSISSAHAAAARAAPPGGGDRVRQRPMACGAPAGAPHIWLWASRIVSRGVRSAGWPAPREARRAASSTPKPYRAAALGCSTGTASARERPRDRGPRRTAPVRPRQRGAARPTPVGAPAAAPAPRPSGREARPPPGDSATRARRARAPRRQQRERAALAAWTAPRPAPPPRGPRPAFEPAAAAPPPGGALRPPR
jgi:hypothetical protein